MECSRVLRDIAIISGGAASLAQGRGGAATRPRAGDSLTDDIVGVARRASCAAKEAPVHAAPARCSLSAVDSENILLGRWAQPRPRIGKDRKAVPPCPAALPSPARPAAPRWGRSVRADAFRVAGGHARAPHSTSILSRRRVSPRSFICARTASRRSLACAALSALVCQSVAASCAAARLSSKWKSTCFAVCGPQ